MLQFSRSKLFLISAPAEKDALCVRRGSPKEGQTHEEAAREGQRVTIYRFLGGMSLGSEGTGKGARPTWPALVPERRGIRVMMWAGGKAGVNFSENRSKQQRTIF